MMMNNCLSNLSIPELSPPRLLSRSDRYLCAALSSSSRILSTPRDASHVAFLDTSVGPATVVLLRALGESQPAYSSARSLSDIPQTQRDHIGGLWPISIEVLRSAIGHAIPSDSTTPSDDGSEVLYGRAGLLYAVLRLRSSVDQILTAAATSVQKAVISTLRPLISDAVVGQLTECIIQQGKKWVPAAYCQSGSRGPTPVSSHSVPPLMWSWHGKRYLGGAHGVGQSPPRVGSNSRTEFLTNCYFL